MANQNATRPVKALATHHNPDIDDVEAIRLLINHGESHFPGISTASIITSANRTPWGKSLKELGEEEVLCVGIGGSIFDEHAHEGKPQQRDECAATLVAKYLGLENNPAVQATTAYALEKNYSARTHEWEIAPLIKLAFRYGVTSENSAANQESTRVFKAAFFFLDLVEKYEASRASGTSPQGQVSTSMDQVIAGWLLKTFGGEDYNLLSRCVNESRAANKALTTTVARALGKVEDSTLRFIIEYGASQRTAKYTAGDEVDFRLAELVYLAQSMLCTGTDEENLVWRVQICQAAEVFIEAVWKKDINFLIDCRNDFEMKSTRQEIVGTARGTLTITSVVSDNPEIAKFCRSKHGGNAAVVVKQESSGNIQVFFDQSWKINPAPIVAALRTAERMANGYNERLPREILESIGDAVPGAEAWYFDSFQIMNGSLTTDKEPTKLPRRVVEAIVLKEVRKL